jgi:hypothetical protein
MTERPDYYHTPAELSAEARLHLIREMLRKIRYAQGEKNPSETMIYVDAERAHKLWKWIPSDRLSRTVDRALYVHGAKNLTLEHVSDVWVKRDRKLRPSDEERERRRKAAEERAEREKAPPEAANRFFQSIQSQLQ